MRSSIPGVLKIQEHVYMDYTLILMTVIIQLFSILKYITTLYYLGNKLYAQSDHSKWPKLCSRSNGLFEIPNESFPSWHTEVRSSATVTHPHNNPSISRPLVGHLPKGCRGWHLSRNIRHVHVENPVTRKAHKNNKKKIKIKALIILTGSEWMNGPASAREKSRGIAHFEYPYVNCEQPLVSRSNFFLSSVL